MPASPGPLATARYAAAVERLLSLSEDKKPEYLASLSHEELQALMFDWYGVWAREHQVPPPGDWRIWVVMAGRGWGKTRTGAEWVRWRVETGQARRIALVARTKADIRDVLVDGPSGIMHVCPHAGEAGLGPIYEPSKRRITWPNGAIATLYSADEPDQLRGPQHDTAWCLAATTPIRMADDTQRPICRIEPGDFVATRQGPRRVRAAVMTQPAADLWRLTTSDGRTLTGTRDHPVWVNGEFVPLHQVPPGGILWSWQAPYSMLGRPTSTPATTTSATLAASSSTVSCGPTLMARFRRVMSCITKTGTNWTTGSPTSSYSAKASTTASMGQWAGQHGIPTSAVLGARSPGQAAYPARGSASTAARRTRPAAPTAGGVGRNAVQPRDTTVALRVEYLGFQAAVFNLEIEGDHEFFANDLLTHNCDELASWRRPEAWDNLMLGLRMGTDPRVIVTTTPKRVALMRKILSRANVYITRGSTYENVANLAPAFIEQVKADYEGTRLAQQELHGVLMEDNPDALWSYTLIEELRKRSESRIYKRVVIGVDPEASSTEDSAETGIIACARGYDNHLYVLDDATVRGTPHIWGKQVAACYQRWLANLVVGEVNNGGDMVGFVIEQADKRLAYKAVRASRGKLTRAEPISALYEKKWAHHVGYFPELESQMCSWVPGEKSPDRMDALVWAATELMIGSGMAIRPYVSATRALPSGYVYE